jgi:hypothetical protein
MRDQHPIRHRSPDGSRRPRRLGLLQGVVLAAALVLGVAVGSLREDARTTVPQQAAAVPPPAAPELSTPPQHRAAAPSTRTAPQPAREPRLASFGGAHPSADVEHVAHWVVDSGDNRGKAIVLVDKKNAHVWVLDPDGGYIADTPALIGSAIGDDAVPGIGDKPLSQVLPEERTTPAGRFEAELGENANHEDVVWVSWDLAVSMHRVRPTVKAERRLERLASATADDNRISFGCINLPVAFYEQVLRRTVEAMGAVIYVLPETRTPQQQFGSYDVARTPRLALSPTFLVK